jgi:hypothetical protein
MLARSAVVLLAVAGLSACGQSTGAPAGHSAPSAPPSDTVTVPAQLAVPDGQRLVATLHVDRGSQVYTCSAGKWTLKEPAAVLRSATQEVLHTAGPQWISAIDGSAVTAATAATVAVPNAVPELLLKATANRGSGLFSTVDFVQRLDTHGGVAPAGQCTDGTLQAVGYSAEYRFYAPA